MRPRIRKNTSYELVEIAPSVSSNYIEDADGVIYKVMDNHYLKLSPWKDGEDRRVQEVDLGSCKMLTYKNACMIVNSQFANTVEEWDHHGKHFIANTLGENRNVEEHSYFLSTLPSHKMMLKDATKILDEIGSSTLSITSEDGMQELKMVKHKGKIYFILILNQFLPRVQAYNAFGEFCQWIGIGDCKPIFNATDKRYM